MASRKYNQPYLSGHECIFRDLNPFECSGRILHLASCAASLLCLQGSHSAVVSNLTAVGIEVGRVGDGTADTRPSFASAWRTASATYGMLHMAVWGCKSVGAWGKGSAGVRWYGGMAAWRHDVRHGSMELWWYGSMAVQCHGGMMVCHHCRTELWRYSSIGE